MIYKFRIHFEDYDDVYRDIEINSQQSFEDLKLAILKSINFDTIHECIFFMSDDSWRKGRDLTQKKDGTPFELSKRIICDFVEEPHQRFLFIYDLNVQWSFFVELLKISKSDPNVVYPLVVKSFGAAPKQYKPVYIASPSFDDEDSPKKGKRGRKPGSVKEIEKDTIDDEEIDDDSDVEIEEDISYIEESDIDDGFESKDDDDPDETGGEDDIDEYGNGYDDENEMYNNRYDNSADDY